MNRKIKFTPGPWSVFGEGFMVAVMSKVGCVAKTVDGALNNEDWTANANLISAAPELLFELEKQCLRCFQDQLCQIPEDCKECTTRQVIRKAYGEKAATEDKYIQITLNGMIKEVKSPVQGIELITLAGFNAEDTEEMIIMAAKRGCAYMDRLHYLEYVDVEDDMKIIIHR